MLEALWSVEFVSIEGWGTGVAVLETQRILGGDANYLYIGSFRVKGGKGYAEVEVKHYAGPSNSIIGDIKEFNLKLEGIIDHDAFEMKGNIVELPAIPVVIRLTRRAELPD